MGHHRWRGAKLSQMAQMTQILSKELRNQGMVRVKIPKFLDSLE